MQDLTPGFAVTPGFARERTGEYNPAANAIQIMTMKVSKGLEFPVP